jgi:hypothetical protein
MKSGAYNYFLNGNLTAVTETFDVKILPNGSRQTTSIRSAKPFKTIITVETVEINGNFESCRIDYRKDEINLSAVYEFAETSFRIRRKLNGEIIQNETIKLPADALFFPLMRCFQGQTISRIAGREDFTTVIVPDIQPTSNTRNLLKQTFDKRTADILSTNRNLRIFSYLSDKYDEQSEFCLDETDLLVHYKFVQSKTQTWEVKLVS